MQLSNPSAVGEETGCRFRLTQLTQCGTMICNGFYSINYSLHDGSLSENRWNSYLKLKSEAAMPMTAEAMKNREAVPITNDVGLMPEETNHVQKVVFLF